MTLILDAHDEAVYRQAFLLSEAVRRFLARRQTQKIIKAGLLDDDVVRDLVESSELMMAARRSRIAAAERFSAEAQARS